MLFCLLFLLPTVQYANVDLPESELLARYAHLQGVDSMTYSSLGTALVLSTDFSRASKILRAFESEFHVEYSKDFPAHLVRRPNLDFLIDEATISKDRWSEQFSQNSLIVLAYKKSVKDGLIGSSDKLVRCRYTLRPWITFEGKRTETAVGIFSFKSGGIVKDRTFAYDPSRN